MKAQGGGNVTIYYHVSPTCLLMLCFKTLNSLMHTRLILNILIVLTETSSCHPTVFPAAPIIYTHLLVFESHYRGNICVNNTLTSALEVLRWHSFLAELLNIERNGSHQAIQ